jgi:DNA polymerase elongation subunit (family B)
MEFQLLTVHLSDRLPMGVRDMDHSDLRDEALDPDLLDLERTPIEETGTSACVFGRTLEGKSVCVRVHNVRPCLFFRVDEGDTLESLRRELAREVSAKMGRDGRLELEEATFCHFYGYEPDATSPSGRQRHRYVKASYPSVQAWRFACAQRKALQIPVLRAKVEGLEAALKELKKNARTEAETRYNNAKEQLKSLEEECRGVPETESPPRPAHEMMVDPLTRFLHDCGLTPSEWYRVTAPTADVRISLCQEERVASLDGFVPVPDCKINAPYVSLYYDIETLGLDPEKTGIIQVSLVFVCGGVVDKHVVVLDRTDPVDGATVHTCANEMEVLVTTRRLVIQHDPDFVTAYNGVNFDNRFLAVRAETACTGGVEIFWYLSRFAFQRCRLRELRLTSNGMGDNVLRYFDMPGRTNFDWYVKLKRDLTSEPSYKLDHFAKTICGDQKEELASGLKWKRVGSEPSDGVRLECAALTSALAQGTTHFAQDVWDAVGVDDLHARHYVKVDSGVYYVPAHVKHHAIAPLQVGTARDRARLASYCVHDSYLLHLLNEARTMTIEILQFAGVFHVIPEWIYFRGQQVRYVSQLLRTVRIAEAVPLLLQTPHEGWSGVGVEGYAGGAVNEPMKGFYKEPVAVLDWKSLYPSIMISHNLCPSTLVRNPALQSAEGVVEHRIDEDFVTHFTTKHAGILPHILKYLLEQRGQTKKLMKRHATEAKRIDLTPEEVARHTMLAKVCDGRQLALKVACNSVYGACGAMESGKVPCLAVSAATTFRGREAMEIKKTILPQRFPGICVRYGDSVAEYTPMLVRVDERVAIVTPRELWDWAEPVPNGADAKEAATLTGVSTWTERGWTPITTVLRHRAGKTMFRVATHTGVVDVTEDHSLLRPDGTPCTAQECLSDGGCLLHAWPPPETQSQPAVLGEDLSLARILGFFVGDGSCGPYTASSGSNHSWALHDADYTMLDRYRKECEAVFGHPFEILDTLKTSGVYKLVPHCGDLETLSLRFREMCYGPDGLKKIPNHILNGSTAARSAFLVGLYDADGARGRESVVPMSHGWQAGSVTYQKSERVALGLFHILRALDFNVSIHTRADKVHMYRIHWTMQTLRKKENAIKSCMRLEADPNAYVYDLSTANHHFHAGVGQTIVHNTDSVFVTFDGVTDLQEVAALSVQASDFVTDYFVNTLKLPAMELEFEKIYWPWCIETKKRYFGNKYMPNGKGLMEYKGVDAAGVETERKDTLPFTKEIMHDVFQALLVDMDEAKALRCFDHHIERLLSNKVPMEQLTLRKNLSGKVVHKTSSIAHARVNDLKRSREAGSESAVNEQVEYVILNGHKKSKTTELAEDPVYAKEHGLKLNLLWYFEHCIVEPLGKIFHTLPGIDYDGRVKVYKARLNGERLRVNTGGMSAFFS